MIEITQFTLEAPDSDGEMRPEAEVEITNTSEEQCVKSVTQRYFWATMGPHQLQHKKHRRCSS